MRSVQDIEQLLQSCVYRKQESVNLSEIQLYIMDYLWEKAYIGGQNNANFGWRYSHTITMGKKEL